MAGQNKFRRTEIGDSRIEKVSDALKGCPEASVNAAVGFRRSDCIEVSEPVAQSCLSSTKRDDGNILVTCDETFGIVSCNEMTLPEPP